MQSLRPNGTALLLGTIGYLAVMAVHPPGPSAMLSPQEYSAALRRLIGVHVSGIVFAPILLFGVLGMVTFLRRSHLAILAAVLYAFATLALVVAVLLHGVVGPSVELQQQTYTPESREHLKLFFTYLRELNSVLERCFALGSLVAVLLWSMALRSARLGPLIVPIAGIAASALLLLAIALGVLPLDHRGMAIAIFTPGAWIIAIALMMLRYKPGPETTQRPAQLAGTDA